MLLTSWESEKLSAHPIFIEMMAELRAVERGDSLIGNNGHIARWEVRDELTR